MLRLGTKRDAFEAGLNEAAASLATTYGRWSSVRGVERGGCGARREPIQHFEDDARGDGRESGICETICVRFTGRFDDVCQQGASLPTGKVGLHERRHGLDAWTCSASLAS
jgi:hypothetical protein